MTMWTSVTAELSLGPPVFTLLTNFGSRPCDLLLKC